MAVDQNAYAPTYNSLFWQKPAGDAQRDRLSRRESVLLHDDSAIRTARNTAPALLQNRLRVMGELAQRSVHARCRARQPLGRATNGNSPAGALGGRQVSACTVAKAITSLCSNRRGLSLHAHVGPACRGISPPAHHRPSR